MIRSEEVKQFCSGSKSEGQFPPGQQQKGLVGKDDGSVPCFGGSLGYTAVHTHQKAAGVH